MNKFVNVSINFVKHNAPTILTIAGSVGVIATAVATAKATPKAIKLIEEEEEKKGDELTKFEKFKVAAPAYVPAIIFGVGTISCIVGSNMLNQKRQASLASAYALLDRSYKTYRDKVVELYGEDGDRKIKEEIAKDKYEKKKEEDGDKELFYDEYSERYFEITMENFTKAQYELNRIFHTTDVVALNDWYHLLGVDGVEGGDLIGWMTTDMYEKHWHSWLEFKLHKTIMDDGMECNIIETLYDPFCNFASNYFSRR